MKGKFFRKMAAILAASVMLAGTAGTAPAVCAAEEAAVDDAAAEAERLESERLESERLESERLESERLESERLESERLESERLESERLESERLESERLESERLESERLESERLESERLESERLESERLESERLESERLESERLESERLESERLESERLESERLESERLESERLESEKAAAAQQEEESRESETQEKETEESETEETEPQTEETGHPENSGPALTLSGLKKDLSGVLEMTVAAKFYAGDDLPETERLYGKKAADSLEPLKKLSLAYANATSSSDVKVLNLFADEDGKLDASALKKAFGEEAVAASGQVTLINIIAASADQKLDITGFPVKRGGTEVSFAEGTEPGVVLYNFAAWQDGSYHDYTGTVAVKRGSGSFLAPAGTLELEGTLYGTLWAESVTLKKGSDLHRTILAGTASESAAPETQPETMPDEVVVTGDTEETQPDTMPESPQEETQPDSMTEPPQEETQPESGAEEVVITDLPQAETPLQEIVSNRVKSFAMARTMLSQLLPMVAAAENPESEDNNKTEEPVVPELTDDVVVTLQASRNGVTLTAVKEQTAWVTLFEDEALTTKAEGQEPVKITLAAGKTASEPVHLTALTVGNTYYIAETDENGTVLKADTLPYTAEFMTKGENDQEVKITSFTVNNKSEESEDGTGMESDVIALWHRYSTYPDGEYSFDAEVTVTKEVKAPDGTADHAVTDTFYITLFRDEAHTVKAAEPIAVAMNAEAQKTAAPVKLSITSETLYAAETNAQGTPLTDGDGVYFFTPSWKDGADQDTKGVVSIPCAEKASAAVKVTNTLAPARTTLHIVNDSGAQLPGVTYVIRDAKRNIVTVGGTVLFTSAAQAMTIVGDLPDGQYYLSEVNAPNGYLPAADVPFTVETGKATEATAVNRRAAGTRSANVSIQVYEGEHLLYAQDTTTGAYAKKGVYTRYAALFADAARTQKVSNVQTITLNGFAGSTVFRYLDDGTVYYVAETDQYGTALSKGNNYEIRYTDKGQFTAGRQTAQRIIQEIYSSLPEGFRYTARLTVEKRVTDHDKKAKAVTDTFYVGVFRNSDFSDTPTILTFEMNQTSSSVVSRRILLPESGTITYYFAEVDKNGKRVTETPGFQYIPTFENNSITLTKSSEMTNVLVNREKISNVTFYLTKRVYEGTTQKKTTGTFYAGLFKDPEFKELLYKNPIPLELKNADSVTLKLSMNLGTSDSATFYVAEVDKDGRIVRGGKDFGYDIRVINAKVEFNQDKTEIQSVLLNSVAGTTSEKDWNAIIGNKENSGANISNGGGAVSQNGTAAGGSGVATGDETPVMQYVIVLASAAVVLIAAGLGLALSGKKRKKRKK